jgi:GWxTD domain-containing protein
MAQVQRPPEPVRKQGGAREAAAPTEPDAEPVTPYKKWMNEDVTYILTDNERQSFKQLTTDEEREKFIEQFWLRRDPISSTAANEFKEEYYRRIAYANERFGGKLPGWKTDRGRIYIVYGPADEIESHPSGGLYLRPAEQGGGTTSTFPFEQWRYKFIEGIGTNVVVEFVDTERNGEFRQTLDPRDKDVERFAKLQAGGGAYWAKTWPRPAGKFYVIGEVVRPGEYSPTAPVTVLQALVNAGGFTGTANTKAIVIQRGTLRMTFNYDEVFRGINPAQNIMLMPGDRVTVK